MQYHFPLIEPLPGLGAEVIQDLRAHGILSYLQLAEFVLSPPSRGFTQRFFGEEPPELRRILEPQIARRLPAGLIRELEQTRFSIPSLSGLAGPHVTFSAAPKRSRPTKADHQEVVNHLIQLEREGRIPKRKLLTDFMTPVRSQGGLGSCTGWASSVSREFLALAGREALSPLFAYKGAKKIDGRPDLEGSRLEFCCEFFCRFGHLRESDYPYTDEPNSLELADDDLERAREFLATGYSDVLLSQDHIHYQPLLIKAILSGAFNGDLGPRPVDISVAVLPCHNSKSTALTGIWNLSSEPELGGHAMSVVGYFGEDDPHNPYGIDLFLAKNSWGTEWARHNPFGFPGYALIPGAYFQDPRLVWELLICIAEDSPSKDWGWLGRLRRWSDPKLVAPPASWRWS